MEVIVLNAKTRLAVRHAFRLISTMEVNANNAPFTVKIVRWLTTLLCVRLVVLGIFLLIHRNLIISAAVNARQDVGHVLMVIHVRNVFRQRNTTVLRQIDVSHVD